VITAGRVTVGEPHPGAGSSPLGTQALIREARQRQRRRWRRRGLVGVSLALLAAAAVTGAVGLSGPAARLPVRTAAPAPPGPAAAMPSRLVVCTAWAADGTPPGRAGRPPGRGERGGDRPGRQLAGHRQRRRDGADLGRGRHPPRRHGDQD
jgi:hypothetical protein